MMFVENIHDMEIQDKALSKMLHVVAEKEDLVGVKRDVGDAALLFLNLAHQKEIKNDKDNIDISATGNIKISKKLTR